jgi:hypothetical protein
MHPFRTNNYTEWLRTHLVCHVPRATCWEQGGVNTSSNMCSWPAEDRISTAASGVHILYCKSESRRSGMSSTQRTEGFSTASFEQNRSVRWCEFRLFTDRYIYWQYISYRPIIVAALSKAWTVFARSNTGVVGSNSLCVFILCLCCSVYR